MELKDTHKLILVEYDQLPLRIDKRRQDQLLHIKLSSYQKHSEQLRQAVVDACRPSGRNVVMLLCDERSDDYQAVHLGIGMGVDESRVFDAFIALNLFITKPISHHVYPAYVM